MHATDVFNMVDPVYLYRAMGKDDLVSAPLAQGGWGVHISQSLYHERLAAYTWTLSSHFDMRLMGNITLPVRGSQDIAQISTRCVSI